MSGSGSILSGLNGFSGGGTLGDLTGIAIDGGNNVWVTSSPKNIVVKLSNSGSTLSGASGYTGGGLNEPNQIAIDGSGNAWIANTAGKSVTELTNAGMAVSGPLGYASGVLIYPVQIALDGSGDVWLTGGAPAGGPGIAELIGGGTPVVTPLAVGVKNNTLGTRP